MGERRTASDMRSTGPAKNCSAKHESAWGRVGFLEMGMNSEEKGNGAEDRLIHSDFRLMIATIL